MHRKIIHIDMDAFYASVEQRDDPSLRGKPLAVGGTSGKGVIAAASYEARKFGVKSAMPVRVALRKCPNLITIKPNFDKYKAVSQEIRAIFERYTDRIEPLSLDEAFLDVTENNTGASSATFIAQEIKNAIANELHLIASAGVSYNKFLAKMASDMDKPNGLYIITPDKAHDFLVNLKIEDFFGVGKVTAQKFNTYGIFKGADLLDYSKTDLEIHFGKTGVFLYSIVRGIDERPVVSDRVRKSIGAENTYAKVLTHLPEMKEAFMNTFETFWSRYEKYSRNGKTVTIKIKYSDFEVITRSKTFPILLKEKEQVRSEVLNLFESNVDLQKPIRLMGITISNLSISNVDEGSDNQLDFGFF